MPNESRDTIVRRFERQAIAHAERIAVNHAGEQSSTRWTYGELNHHANCIARAIVERAAKLSDASSTVALLMDMGAPSVAAIIGTMKAGRVCVPIDSSYPETRIRQMIQDAGAQLLVTDALNVETALRIADSGCAILNADGLLFEEDTSQETRNLNLDIDPNSAAYLIYTSGSTGRPKGVIETHRNVLHHVEHYAEVLDYQPTDRIALLASCSVGQGMKTFCSTLLNGAALCPFDIKTRGIESLTKWMLEEKITVLISVPSVFRRMVRQTSTRSEFPDLRLIRLGGETLHRQDVEDFRQAFSPQCRLANSFSSTETGNIALFFIDKSTPINGDTVPVGFVSEGTKISIVDDLGHEVSPDEVGEIVVHSAWLSPGYWGNPQLTQQAFQAGRTTGEQTYRTGDLGSLSRDGCLYHRGRKDSQVKIRGFRVELGEVEAALTTHSAIREAVVVARPNAQADNSLLSFVVLEDAREVNGRELRRFLADKLPQHAIPVSYERLKELPLTSNGKIDRAQLLLTAPKRTNGVDEANPVAIPSGEDWPDAPRGEIEKRLAKIWMDVLQVPRVDRHDDFFELGGHSLLTVALLSQIEKSFSQSMAHSAMFGAATIASQAELLRCNEAQNSAAWPSIVALQLQGTRPPLFFVHDMNDSLLCYRELVRCLHDDQPVYGLRPAQQNDKSSTHIPSQSCSIQEMAATYVSEICAFQPHGAFYLCGYSFAGTLAFEIACQLEAQGRRVAFLALLDTSCRADPMYQEQKDKPLTRRQRQQNHRYIWRHLRTRDRIIYFSYYAQERVNWIRERYTRQKTTDKRSLLKDEVVRRFVERSQRNKLASACYPVQSYAGRITLFRAMLDYRKERSPDLGWKLVARGGVDVVAVPGNHHEILKLPHVRMLARHFRRCLREAQKNNSLGSRDAGDLYEDNPASNADSCARNLVATDDAKCQF